MVADGKGEALRDWRDTLHEIIFEADTRAGKAFDVALLVCICSSVLAVSLESVTAIEATYGRALRAAEWMFTALFTIEYGLRLICVRRPARYAWSFFGVVDLLAVIPTYVSLIVPGAQSLLVIRSLRLLRIFRVFKLGQFIGEASVLMHALRQSRRKIAVFIGTIILVDVIMGALMYLIEGPEGGFTSIPRGMYWAIVTMTTVGYGDVSPVSILGQIVASILMVAGYGIIAVPTGIFSMELAQASRRAVSTQACRSCAAEGHDADARYCKYCGVAL